MRFQINLGPPPSDDDGDSSKKQAAIAAPKRPGRAPAHHRAFRDWLKTNHSRFAIAIQLIDKPGGWLDFSFVGIHPSLSGSLTERGLCVLATYQGTCWDMLFDFDAYPKRAAGGYLCSECLPEYKKLFVDRAALWADHLFERLLRWVNEELVPARWLVLEGEPESYSYARLTGEAPQLMSSPDASDRTVTLVISLRVEAPPDVIAPEL
jgi:hypothetical protein